MQKRKSVGRLSVPLAQLINTALDEDETLKELDVHASIQGMQRAEGDDPYAIDIAALPSPIAAPKAASFHDYIEAGYLLDFCIAIDFTSSNGKWPVTIFCHL